MRDITDRLGMLLEKAILEANQSVHSVKFYHSDFDAKIGCSVHYKFPHFMIEQCGNFNGAISEMISSILFRQISKDEVLAAITSASSDKLTTTQMLDMLLDKIPKVKNKNVNYIQGIDQENKIRMIIGGKG